MTDRYTWNDLRALGVSIHWDASYRHQVVRHDAPDVTREVVAHEVARRVAALRGAAVGRSWPAFECGRCGEPVDYQITVCGLCSLACEALTDERWAAETANPTPSVATPPSGAQAVLPGLGKVVAKRKKGGKKAPR